MDDVTAAHILLKSLDLTSLNDNDNEYSIENLCERAVTPYGNVAAVCVYPRFLPVVMQMISGTNIKIATVVNFPHGGDNFISLQMEIRDAIAKGADEIDAVFPYKSFLNKDYQACEKFMKIARSECESLKVILETGELGNSRQIADATKICLAGGADFIKTSTGKTKVSATPEAANIILETIASNKKLAGFKASGGIKTIDDAKKYLTLANTIMDPQWVSPKTFRIGASSLLNNLLEVIKRGY